VLISPKGDRLLYVIRLHFRATNNMEEYEALVNVIPWSKEAELKLPYVYPGSYIACTMTHHGKIDAMFNYLNRAVFSYINDSGVSKRLQRSKHRFTKRSAASTGLTIREVA
jgi:hypothetical protein